MPWVAKLRQVEVLPRRKICSDNRGQFSRQAFFHQRSADAVGIGHDCQGARFGRQAAEPSAQIRFNLRDDDGTIDVRQYLRR